MGILEIAREEVVTASPSDYVLEIAAKMDEENIGSVVLTDDNIPAGIITDRDITTKVVAKNKDPQKTLGKDIMTEHPFTVDEDEGIFNVIQKMHESGVRRVPIVDMDINKIEGIVTMDDLVWLLSKELNNLSTIIEKESPPQEK